MPHASTPLRSAVYVCSVLFIALITLLAQFHLLHLFPWEDEYETIVAARMLAAGARLYTDVFDKHGPLTFLPGYALGRFGLASVVACRVFMLALQSCALGLAFRLAWTLERSAAPLWLGFAAVWTTCVLPAHFGHAYLYQTLGAALFSVALSTICLPGLFGSQRGSGTCAFIGGGALGCLPFLAFTYDVATVLLFVAFIRRATAPRMIAGCAVAVIFNFGWLVFCGDVRGYVVEHYYLNLFILPAYIYYPALGVKDIVIATVATGVVVLAAARAVRCGSGLWRPAFVVLAFMTLLCRGLNVHALAAYGFVLPASAVVLARRWPWLRSSAYAPISGVALSLLALFTWRPAWEASFRLKTSSPFARFVDTNTAPSDRIIVYSFMSSEYVLANRLPATADFFLLPSQVAYDRRPALGFRLNACKRLVAANPKIVKLDRWRVYDQISWDSYGTCIEKYITSQYRQTLQRGVYIRRDAARIQ